MFVDWKSYFEALGLALSSDHYDMSDSGNIVKDLIDKGCDPLEGFKCLIDVVLKPSRYVMEYFREIQDITHEFLPYIEKEELEKLYMFLVTPYEYDNEERNIYDEMLTGRAVMLLCLQNADEILEDVTGCDWDNIDHHTRTVPYEEAFRMSLKYEVECIIEYYLK